MLLQHQQLKTVNKYLSLYTYLTLTVQFAMYSWSIAIVNNTTTTLKSIFNKVLIMQRYSNYGLLTCFNDTFSTAKAVVG
jgi:hypothetical protein